MEYYIILGFSLLALVMALAVVCQWTGLGQSGDIGKRRWKNIADEETEEAPVTNVVADPPGYLDGAVRNWDSLTANTCPKCGAVGKGFHEGPRSGEKAVINIACSKCGATFNVAPIRDFGARYIGQTSINDDGTVGLYQGSEGTN